MSQDRRADSCLVPKLIFWVKCWWGRPVSFEVLSTEVKRFTGRNNDDGDDEDDDDPLAEVIQKENGSSMKSHRALWIICLKGGVDVFFKCSNDILIFDFMWTVPLKQSPDFVLMLCSLSGDDLTWGLDYTLRSRIDRYSLTERPSKQSHLTQN